MGGGNPAVPSNQRRRVSSGDQGSLQEITLKVKVARTRFEKMSVYLKEWESLTLKAEATIALTEGG